MDDYLKVGMFDLVPRSSVDETVHTINGLGPPIPCPKTSKGALAEAIRRHCLPCAQCGSHHPDCRHAYTGLAATVAATLPPGADERYVHLGGLNLVSR